MKQRIISWEEAAALLAAGEVGVVPTDTLYGLLGRALDPGVVERVYDLRLRDRDKPLIVLMSDVDDLALFKIEMTLRTQELLSRVWPGPVSVIVPVNAPELVHLHRGTGGIAFRVPDMTELRDLLRATGPLVAPSANLEGEKPARSVDEAHAYFGDEVFYLDVGVLEGDASALVDARGEEAKVLRSAPGFDLSVLD